MADSIKNFTGKGGLGGYMISGISTGIIYISLIVPRSTVLNNF